MKKLEINRRCSDFLTHFPSSQCLISSRKMEKKQFSSKILLIHFSYEETDKSINHSKTDYIRY